MTYAFWSKKRFDLIDLVMLFVIMNSLWLLVS